VNSGIRPRTEIGSGRTVVADGTWGWHRMTADVDPDAIYIKVKAKVEGAGTAWIANLNISP
jgi:hypothetical protein